jgi:hypothetical protein
MSAAASCSPGPYRRNAPIGGCPYQKLFDLFFPFANIYSKRNLNTVKSDAFWCNMSHFTRKSKEMILSAEKRDIVDRE